MKIQEAALNPSMAFQFDDANPKYRSGMPVMSYAKGSVPGRFSGRVNGM